jgi:hypothetical protein
MTDFRRAAYQRRHLKPLLACYWYLAEGRLECRWLLAADFQGSIAAKVNVGDSP